VSIEDVPEVRGFDYDKLPLKITAVLYDPEGTDKDNEVIVVSLNNDSLQEDNTNLFFTLSGIDFSDNFKLTIFPRSEYTT
jgi:hypothetical protein